MDLSRILNAVPGSGERSDRQDDQSVRARSMRPEAETPQSLTRAKTSLEYSKKVAQDNAYLQRVGSRLEMLKAQARKPKPLAQDAAVQVSIQQPVSSSKRPASETLESEAIRPRHNDDMEFYDLTELQSQHEDTLDFMTPDHSQASVHQSNQRLPANPEPGVCEYLRNQKSGILI